MKVGILSMQEVKNYGSFLQAYSLKKNIEKLGHSVEFINIEPGKQIGEYKQGRFHKFRLLIGRLWGWDFLKRAKAIYQFQSRFGREFLPELGVKCGITIGHFDTVVIGSDEVFNCAQKTWFGFSPQLFGEGLNADKTISYAGCFGATTMERLETLGLRDRVATLLNNFSVISVRDENSESVVLQLSGQSPFRHVDPVLIYDYDSLMPSKVAYEKYIVVYSYPGRMSDSTEIDSIRAFARKKSLKLLSIGHYFSWCDAVVVPHPFEVLAYFRYADYVVTDTFHGSVFSLKYNKQFATIVRGMNSNKLGSLLGQFGLDGRIVADMQQLERVLESKIDYQPINETLELEKKRSVQYLKDNL